jgi:hypothetical protein
LSSASTALKRLRSNPLYQFGSFRNTPAVIYDDDRWLLPVLLAAQQDGLLPQPSLLVTFDQHEDSLPVRKGLGPIPSIRKEGYREATFVELVRDHLSPLDDDWIKAGMELGLISDVAAFGIQDYEGQRSEPTYTDHLGVTHRLFMETGLPGRDLTFQGSLSDLARETALRSYWEVLGWEHSGRGGRFGFREELPKIILNVDLDCFAVYWREYRFPWPEEVFVKEFQDPSGYFSTRDLTGADFFCGLAERAGVITIAREPQYTGGEEKGALILQRVARHLFGGELRLKELE